MMFPFLSFLSPYTTLIKWAGIAVAAAGIWYSGYHFEKTRFESYKAEVEAAGTEQMAKNESIKKQQDLVTKGIQDEYKAKLDAVRSFYANGLSDASGRPMPTSGQSPSGVNGSTSNNVPATTGQIIFDCAKETVKLIQLQKFEDAQDKVE